MRAGRRAALIALPLACAWIVAFPAAALATVRGPCDVTLAGQSIDEGHDTPGTAIRLSSARDVDVRGVVGSADAAGVAFRVSYTVPFAGVAMNFGGFTTGAGEWTHTVPVASLSWAWVGLFRLDVDAETSFGPCRGVAYFCVTGRSPLATALGLIAVLGGTAGLSLLAASLRRVRHLRPGRLALQSFVGEALATASFALLLQQSCIGEFDVVSAAVLPAGTGILAAVTTSLAQTLLGPGGGRR